MAELKTRATDGDVDAFIDSIADEVRREDARRIDALMRSVTRRPAVMWGPSMVGYGTYDYTNTSGGGTMFTVGWAPRKDRITLYVMDGFDSYDELLAELGPYTAGKSCLHIKRLDQVDLVVLRKLVAASVKHVRANNPTT